MSVVAAPGHVSKIPETVGPYRIEGRLGEGGMGEVFRGSDSRLDRSVALKRVKPETADPDRAQQRFQREARVAAGLNHRAIVQVHDWLETEDGDWIVMELVHGRSLRQVLAAGPLAVERVLGVAHEIAAGLAAAHDAGLVHRDLKAENVQIADSGDVKILDFGLARQLPGGDGVPLSTSISVDGQIVGTVTSMSPEQAMGESVDHRSDLFSLGTLLYELLTGVSPFQGSSSVETLTRICTMQEAPISEHRPDVPVALSDLVTSLLRKQRSRRPENARAVIVALDECAAGVKPSATAHSLAQETLDVAPSGWTARPRIVDRPPAQPGVIGRLSRRWVALAGLALVGAALAVAAAFFRPWSPRPAPPPTFVVVPETTTTSGETEQNRLVLGAVQAGVLRGLLGYRQVFALEPEGPERRPHDPVALARTFAADEILASEVTCGAGRLCEIALKRIRGSDGVLLWRRRFTATSESLLDLSRGVADQLRGGYPDAALRDGVADLTVQPRDYAAYLELAAQTWTRAEGLALHERLPELESLQRTSPRFLEPYLLAASISRLRFVETRDGADLERAVGAIEQAQALAAEDPRVLRLAADVYLDGGRTADAEAALAALQRIEPGDAHALTVEARLLERRGDHEGALARLQEAVRRQPSWHHHSSLADFAYRNGDLDTARRSLEAMMQRSPKSFDGLSRLAQLELLSGSPERAALLYQELVRHVPEETELTNLGVAYLLLGRYDEAGEAFRQALERTPTSPFALLNLADAELLRGRAAAAAELYDEVLRQAERDPDPQALLTVRAQALARRGRAEEAVAAVREALRLAPENPQWAYEAALVYCVVGDETSALLEARRALEEGVEPRWFAFPWFDALRQRLPSIASH